MVWLFNVLVGRGRAVDGIDSVVALPLLSVTVKLAPVTPTVVGSVVSATLSVYPAGIILDGKFKMVGLGGLFTWPLPVLKYWIHTKALLDCTTIKYWSQ